MKIKLSDYVIQFISGIGVKHIFMVPGGGAMHLNNSIGENQNIEFVCNQHEQASAFAAETYSKISNNIGVAVVTTGPGATNAITGVVGAWLDSIPCIIISGQVKRSDLLGTLGVRQNGVQEVDIIPMVKTITKYTLTILEPYSIRYHLEKAFFLAKSGRPGPVWIDIPLDIQASIIDTDLLNGFVPESNDDRIHINVPSQVAETIKIINESKRPILLLGNGIRLSGAQKEVEKLIEFLQIPFLLTWPAMDMFADDHELLVGRPGPVAPRGANFALQNSDCLISIGARLDTVITGYAHDRFARAAKKVMVDIDQSEISKMQTKIDVKICSDAKEFLMEFLKQKDSVLHKNISEWRNKCKEWKYKYPIVLPEHKTGNNISTYYLADILSNLATKDDLILPGSSGAAIEIFLLTFRVKKGQRVTITTALGAMGNGLPACIGGCLAGGRKRTICVDGDGGFQFNIQELETLARLQLPIKIFVVNNSGYSSIRTSQARYFGRLTGADSSSGLSLPDICKVAASYGLPTMKLENNDNLKEQIRYILEMPGPMICNVIAPPDEARMPSMMSMQKPDGSMISKPLEDLWPFLERDEFLSNMLIPPVEEE